MSKNFTSETFDYISELSKLAFTEAERPAMEKKLDDMLTALALPQVDKNVLTKEDALSVAELRTDVVTNAKRPQEQFIVPRSI